MSRRELVEELVASWHPARHRPFCPIYFGDRFAGICSDILSGSIGVIESSNPRLGQISGVVDNDSHRQVIAVPQKMPAENGLFTTGNAIPASKLFLRWSVVTARTSPSHFPVEKPCQEYGA